MCHLALSLNLLLSSRNTMTHYHFIRTLLLPLPLLLSCETLFARISEFVPAKTVPTAPKRSMSSKLLSSMGTDGPSDVEESQVTVTEISRGGTPIAEVCWSYPHSITQSHSHSTTHSHTNTPPHSHFVSSPHSHTPPLPPAFPLLISP